MILWDNLWDASSSRWGCDMGLYIQVRPGREQSSYGRVNGPTCLVNVVVLGCDSGGVLQEQTRLRGFPDIAFLHIAQLALTYITPTAS